MFLGQYERRIDDKSRLAIPANLRVGLDRGAVLGRSFDNCLCIYPVDRWEALARAADDLVQVRYEARALARALFSTAVPCRLDRQGRVVVPAFLREYANLQDEVIVLGVGSHVEIWDREQWMRERQTAAGARARLAEELATVEL